MKPPVLNKGLKQCNQEQSPHVTEYDSRTVI